MKHSFLGRQTERVANQHCLFIVTLVSPLSTSHFPTSTLLIYTFHVTSAYLLTILQVGYELSITSTSGGATARLTFWIRHCSWITGHDRSQWVRQQYTGHTGLELVQSTGYKVVNCKLAFDASLDEYKVVNALLLAHCASGQLQVNYFVCCDDVSFLRANAASNDHHNAKWSHCTMMW